jgi:GT2 family glycosyltransferase
MSAELPSKTPPRVLAVTVNWNSPDDTARLLGAFRAFANPACEVVVVDNGSTDGSLDKLRTAFPEVRFLVLPANAGFGTANNAALREALDQQIPYVWLINNDALPDAGSLAALVARLEADPRAGAAGAVVVDDDAAARIQAWGGGHIRPWLGGVRLHRAPAEPLEFLTGACLLLRTAALREIGLFDERFFLYWEDADLCFRLQKSGWNLVVADTRVRHKGSATTGRNRYLRSFHSGRSLVLFMDRHARLPRLTGLSAIACQSFGKLARGNTPAAAGFWAGFREGLRVLRRPEPTASPTPAAASTEFPHGR